MRLPPKMLCAILFVVMLTLAAGTIHAQDYKYVSDLLQVTLRSGPSIENTILQMVKSGDRLEVLEDNGEGWTRVRSPSGKEGWVLTRYLQSEKTAALRLKEIDPETNDLPRKVEELNQENQQMRQEIAQSQKQVQDLEQRNQEMQGLADSHKTLQEEYNQLKESFDTQQTKLDEVSAEAESMKFGNNLKWFLAGAGVLVLGWILGMLFAKRKKRSSSLYS